MKSMNVITNLLCKKVKEVGMNDRQECTILFLGELETPKEILQARLKKLNK